MDRYSRCCLLLLAITDTQMVRYFIGGFPGSRGDSLAFKEWSWFQAMVNSGDGHRPLDGGEFIPGDGGFGLTALLVRSYLVFNI